MEVKLSFLSVKQVYFQNIKFFHQFFLLKQTLFVKFHKGFLFQAKYGNADGITDVIKESFNDIEESISSSLSSPSDGILAYRKKLVGFTSDGASGEIPMVSVYLVLRSSARVSTE